ncbi:MAG: V-type sodium ATPase subunit C [Firmicutes bacterium ADurb.Bin193]|nr:MAG: V-type sodium ATPase subunit C [Firmicutes bacterium ADurb.Bin193]
MAKTKYKELDYTYAVARLRALENNLLEANGLEKLLSAASADEAAKHLQTIGWKGGNFEEMLQSELEGLFSLIESLGGGEFLKTQRVKYDYHNLKVLIKSELTKQNGDNLIMNLGNIGADIIKNAVINRDYRLLSEDIKSAIALAYEQYARISDAQAVDIIFDGALFHEINEYVKELPEEKIPVLIKMQIDIHNIKTFIRVRKMGKSVGFIEKVTAAGGNIPREFYIENFNAPDNQDAGVFEHTPYRKVFSQDENLELSLDNMFMEEVKATRFGAFGIAPLAAYFWMKENEIRNVRIILICKNAGISEEAIRSRLRG